MRTLLTRLLLIGVAVLATPALAASDTWNGDALGCETFGNSGNYVQKIFMAYLGRPAAPAALEYYASFIDQDAQQGKLILFDDLYYSAEAQQLYRSMPLADQINQFYVLMFGREAKTEGIEYWVGEIEAGRFTVPAAAAYIADAAAVEDLAVLDAKQVAASKVTCAIGDDAGRLSAFQSNLDEARSSLAEIVTAEQAEAYTGYSSLIVTRITWDLYDREKIYLDGLIYKEGCEQPTKNYIDWTMDVDQDGDQDIVFGFECFDAGGMREPEKNPHLVYDEFYQWVAESYLAVLINEEGDFINDQSIFDGEYPVYERLLRSSSVHDPEDINGDGYPDVVIQQHWDNSMHNIINSRFKGLETTRGAFASGGSVLLSDGNGGYTVYMLPVLLNATRPSFYTDEIGDTYLWSFSDSNEFNKNDLELFDTSHWNQPWGPFVGKVSGGTIIDVTDRYFTRIESADFDQNSHVAHCYVRNTVDLTQDFSRELPCLATENFVHQESNQINRKGKVYVNGMHNTQWWADRGPWRDMPEWAQCEELHSDFNAEAIDASLKCKMKFLTSRRHLLPGLEVYGMDSEQGIFLKTSGTMEVEVRYYVHPSEPHPDPYVNPELWREDRLHVQFFVKLNDRWLMSGSGWGLEIGTQGLEQVAMVNIAGALMDEGLQPSDADDFFEFAMRVDPDDRFKWNSLQYYADHATGIMQMIDAGFCPDILERVEPVDCLDAGWFTQNLIDRGVTPETEFGRSLGYTIKNDLVSPDRNLTNRNMAFSPGRTKFWDFDGDGDLDVFINDHNAECGPFCLYENIGEQHLIRVVTGIWADADLEYFSQLAIRCAGPQQIADGYSEDSICDLPYNSTEIDQFFTTWTGFVSPSDIDGDGKWDFGTIKTNGYLEIIYGE